MRISYTTVLGMSNLEIGMGEDGFSVDLTIEQALKQINPSMGFGYASINIIKSLQSLGHEVLFQHPSAPVAMAFCHPQYYEFSPRQYTIGYSPWESSIIPNYWLPGLNSVDEVWVTSEIVKEWMLEAGVKKDIHVYHHGIEHIWTPKRRKVNDVMRFLHHGEPAPRKGGDMALKAFRAAFGDRKDVMLTIKANTYSDLRVKDRRGSIIGNPDQVYGNVTVNLDNLPIGELINLYHRHHAMVYPSYGEGFGFIALQALATGMPTVCTEAWAPYAKCILPKLRLSSKLVTSPWPEMHPGMAFQPDFDQLVETYRYIADNYDTVSKQAYNRAPIVHDAYDWNNLTKNAFAHIVEKFS